MTEPMTTMPTVDAAAQTRHPSDTPRDRRISDDRRYAMTDPDVRHALGEAMDELAMPIGGAEYCGCGGQGIAFRVDDGRHGYPLLIKVPYYAKHRSAAIAEHAILKEAIILHHASRIGPHDFLPRFVAMSGQGRFLIRECIDAPTLFDALQHMPLEDRIRLLPVEARFARQAFRLFHDGPFGCIVIRDFKSRNMMLAPDGRLVLIDYGSSRRETELSNPASTPRHELGSGKFLYRPPEQLAEVTDELSRGIDYFAYGVLLYYTLFLSYPFTNLCGDADAAMRVYRREYRDAARNLERLAGTEPALEAWTETILDALALDPRSRAFRAGPGTPAIHCTAPDAPQGGGQPHAREKA